MRQLANVDARNGFKSDDTGLKDKPGKGRRLDFDDWISTTGFQRLDFDNRISTTGFRQPDFNDRISTTRQPRKRTKAYQLECWTIQPQVIGKWLDVFPTNSPTTIKPNVSEFSAIHSRQRNEQFPFLKSLVTVDDPWPLYKKPHPPQNKKVCVRTHRQH